MSEQKAFSMTAHSTEVKPKKAWITVDDVMLYKREVDKRVKELEAENERLKEAIKHAARILSFGGDVEVMHYLQEALKEQT